MKTKRVILFDLKTSGHHIYYASYLIRYLCKKGHQVMFVTLKGDDKLGLLPHDEPNLTIEYISGKANESVKRNIISRYMQFLIRHAQMIRSLRECFQLANDWKADVVHVLCLDHNILPLYVQCVGRRKRPWHIFGILVKPYFSYHLGERVNFFGKLYRWLDVAMLKGMLGEGVLSGLFVHTIETKDLLIRRFGWQNHYQESIIVVPDPTEMLYGYCSTAEARERLQLPADTPILLFFGGLRWDKGPDLLLEAIKYVKQDFRLVIAGLPEHVTHFDIETYQRQLDDPGRIIARLEYIPDEEVNYYFLSADVVILPYRRLSKGTSGVLQLASAAGKPVITTDVGQIGSIVREHSLGIVVEAESGDALREGIERFLRDRETIRSAVASNALKYAREHDWKKFASLMEAAYTCGDAT
ncbi:glycosyltransferase family 4 protein [Dehalococcoidia bacterium]|nr:glycosyltransferase family 4 protein [Dehalococcoidia bacterium]